MEWRKRDLAKWASRKLKNHRIILVANREPYTTDGGREEGVRARPSGGLTSALEPVMRACGGCWVAADSSSHGNNTPLGEMERYQPDDFSIKRVQLDSDVNISFYNGFCNSAIWPLCHQSFVRPSFKLKDWNAYKEVNKAFAESILDEIRDGNELLFIQDYHFCLVPKLLRDACPDLKIAQFWHIPWPSAETFRICPWAPEILDGMLGSDYLGFQIQLHCNNFIETVDRFLECRIDRERSAVLKSMRSIHVRPNPISVDSRASDAYITPGWERRAEDFMDQQGIPRLPLMIGVDRADYTKGIPDRLAALDILLDRNPNLKKHFHFVQIAVPTRCGIPDYDEYLSAIRNFTERINLKHGEDEWRPITLIDRHVGQREIHYLYKIAAICVVSSLHDGMNLVAKEFVACRDDNQGILLLSEFTGAARELSNGALIFNPHDSSSMADIYLHALGMKKSEQSARMAMMRRHVLENNVFLWAKKVLNQISSMPRPSGYWHDHVLHDQPICVQSSNIPKQAC